MSESLPYEIDIPQKLIDHIRVYTGDLPEFNRLIEGTEVSDEKIELAAQLWIDNFNNVPPVLAKSYNARDFPGYLVLYHGVVIEILKMAGIIQSRNSLQFNDGGATFSVNDKGQEYMQWIQNLMRTHREDVQQLKIGLNAEESYDFHDSPESWWPERQ